MTLKSNYIAWLALTLVACGGGTPKPAAPPPVTPPPAPSASAAEPEPEPVTEEPDAGAEEQAPPEEQPPAKPSHGPVAMFTDPGQPTMVGYDGAEFTVSDGAILEIPPDALNTAKNIWIGVDKKMRLRRLKGKLSPVFMIEVQIPGRRYVVGQSRPSSPLASRGEPFILKLTLPEGTDKANLAIESVTTGAKGRPESTWRVIPMTKLETSDDGNRAVFYITELPDAHVYLTSQEPTVAPAGDTK